MRPQKAREPVGGGGENQLIHVNIGKVQEGRSSPANQEPPNKHYPYPGGPSNHVFVYKGQ